MKDGSFSLCFFFKVNTITLYLYNDGNNMVEERYIRNMERR